MAYQTKSYRKFVATAATAALVASAVAPAASAASQFKDVAAKYQDAVKYLVDNKITEGTSATTFGTYDSVKRGDAAVWIARALGLDTTNAPNAGFTDVNSRVAGAVNALYAAKIISGKSATSFAPDATLTRGEMAKIIANAYELESDKDVPFKDLGPTFGPYIKALYEFGITTGTSETTFGTGSNITRGDFAIFLKRASEVELDPAVKSVTAISATQVVVKFNTAIAKDSVLDANGAIQPTAIFTLQGLDGQSPTTVSGAKLSTDGKTLTLTTSSPVSKRYDVVIEGLKAANGKDVPKYQQVVTFAADTTAPTIVSTTKDSAASYTVKFSEPLQSLGNVTYKLKDGTVVTAGASTVDHNFTLGAEEVTFTLGSDIQAGQEVTATLIGAMDQAGNLLTPNPTTISFVKGAKDGVPPTVSSVTQTGAKTLAIKFSEQLLNAPVVTVSGYTVTQIKKDTTDPTKYIVTTDDVLDGVATVSITGMTDLSGEVGANTSRVVAFVKDSAAPKVTSSVISVDATNKKQYLELTLDKEVELSATSEVAASGTYVKDFITNNLPALSGTVTYKDEKVSKRVVRVELAALLDTSDVEGAVYNLDLTFANVTSAAGISVQDAKASFTRGKDGVPTSNEVVKITGVAQDALNNSKVLVTFDKQVDGASATTAANYKIDGAVVESVTLNAYDSVAQTQVAVLNLKAGSNTFTGVRNVNISGIKALGSTKVMEPYFNTVNLNENVAPTVTSAVLTDTTTITLTFSEAITNGNGEDFEVLIGGKSQSTAEVVDVTVNPANPAQATINVNAITAEKLNAGISLKPLSTIDIVDSVGNKLSVTSNISVRQQ